MNDDKRSGADSGKWHSRYWDRLKFNERKFIRTGAYLDCYCPHCNASMIENQELRLDVIAPDGQEGHLALNPYLNVHEHHADITLPKGDEVKDLRCPHCAASLVVPQRKCPLDKGRVAAILIAVGDHEVPFFFCMRVGCPWQEIHPDVADQIILDDSKEW